MNIKIIRSLRKKTISLQVMPDASITVTVPFFLPNSHVQQILKEKEEWIKKHQQIMQTRNQAHSLSDKETYLYLGKRYPLELRLKQKELVMVSDKLYVATSNKKYVRSYLTSWYRQQARKLITGRVERYANLAGLKYNVVKITEAQTRWGSCSSDKNLNFNWKLVMAPLEVIDYVVAHELAHLVELNHSRAFWETVRKMFPLYRQYRTWLKRYGYMLHV
jgi:predicted metal-dependent hydrolase